MDSTKKKVALATLIVSLVVLIVLLLTPTDTNISSLEFNFHRILNIADDSTDLAREILSDAGIRCSIAYNKEPFIKNVKNDSFKIYYADDSPFETQYHAVIIDISEVERNLSAKEFLKNYEESGFFTISYGEGIKWRYTQEDNTLTPYLGVSPYVLTSEENYRIMYDRPHVETDCKLVEEIIYQIPFNVTEGEYFFVIDENTRMIGWFYFKSNYDGQDFVGCYTVKGWSGIGTTYEDLISLNDFSVKGIKDDTITVSK